MKITTQFIKFALIGVVNTVVHYSVFLLLFRVFGVLMLLSSGIGYSLGVLNSFVMNRRWTFKMVNKANLPEFSRFVVVNVVSLLVNLVVLRALVQNIGVMPEIGQIGAIVASVLVNFSGNKWWTFKA